MAGRFRLPDPAVFYERGVKRAAEIEGTTVEEPKKENIMKLKKPGSVSSIDEKRYLTHCTNIARILTDKNGWGSTESRLEMYVKITGAEVVDD